jgi:hypothetical protein
VCKCVLPPGDNPIAVNKYVYIKYLATCPCPEPNKRSPRPSSCSVKVNFHNDLPSTPRSYNWCLSFKCPPPSRCMHLPFPHAINSCFRHYKGYFSGPMLFSTFRHVLRFFCEELLATRPTPSLEDYLLSAARNRLCSICAAVLHVSRPCPPFAASLNNSLKRTQTTAF